MAKKRYYGDDIVFLYRGMI